MTLESIGLVQFPMTVAISTFLRYSTLLLGLTCWSSKQLFYMRNQVWSMEFTVMNVFYSLFLGNWVIHCSVSCLYLCIIMV